MKIYTKIVFDMNTMETLEEDSYEYKGEVALCEEGDTGNFGGPSSQGGLGDAPSAASGDPSGMAGMFGIDVNAPTEEGKYAGYNDAANLEAAANYQAVVVTRAALAAAKTKQQEDTVKTFWANVKKTGVNFADKATFGLFSLGMNTLTAAFNNKDVNEAQKNLDAANKAFGAIPNLDAKITYDGKVVNSKGEELSSDTPTPGSESPYTQALQTQLLPTGGNSMVTQSKSTPKSAQDVFNSMVDNFYGGTPATALSKSSPGYYDMLMQDADYQNKFVGGKHLNISAGGNPLLSFIPKQTYAEAEYTSPNRAGRAYQQELQNFYKASQGNDPYVKPKSTTLADTLGIVNTGANLWRQVAPYMKSDGTTVDSDHMDAGTADAITSDDLFEQDTSWYDNWNL